MKKIVSLLSFLFFLIISSSLLAEVDIEFLKQKHSKCENPNYRHECFDDVYEQNFRFVGYFVNNSLWDGQHFQDDMLTHDIVNGERINRSFCQKKQDGWFVCPGGTRYKPIDGGYIDNDFKRQGKFIVEFSSGNKYVGEFKDSKRHGQGTFSWAFGDKYVGKYREGNFHGEGTFTFANGMKEIGEWQYGALNGYAIQYDADGGIIREGIFKDDVFQYTQKKPSTNSNSDSKLNKYKEFCEEIGFKLGTDKFADCVLKAMEKD